MNINTRIYLGIGLLFILIILLAFFATQQINSLAAACDNSIRDNKETLAYTQNMPRVLSVSDLDKDALDSFETYLAKQKKNITEAG